MQYLNGKGQHFHGWIVPQSLGAISVLNFLSFHSPIIGMTAQRAHCLQAAERSPLLHGTKQLLVLWHIPQQKASPQNGNSSLRNSKWTWGLDSSVLWKDPVSKIAALWPKKKLKKAPGGSMQGTLPTAVSFQTAASIYLPESFISSLCATRRKRHTHNFTSTEPTLGTFDILAAIFLFSSCAKSRKKLRKETSA